MSLRNDLIYLSKSLSIALALGYSMATYKTEGKIGPLKPKDIMLFKNITKQENGLNGKNYRQMIKVKNYYKKFDYLTINEHIIYY